MSFSWSVTSVIDPEKLTELLTKEVEKFVQEHYKNELAAARKQGFEEGRARGKHLPFYQVIRAHKYPILVEGFEEIFNTFTSEQEARNVIMEQIELRGMQPYQEWLIYKWESFEGEYEVEVIRL